YKREMIDGSHYVDWRAFCKKIEEVRLMANMEVTPLASPERRVIEQKPPQLTQAEEKRLAELLEQMRTRFRIR
ncbi:MAG: hypothetical protein SGPRY_011440, partial [Prymnesium sp.]